ncbi:hypothetical protein [Rhizobium wuzhouense]|uniref:Uncharacterized protein n=1 Tax=Rhizobium wuzhouense TaxID=1986026 RepID=A0ABX5NWX5_9HYPH|nr:hypothetical protein [Rhizobium wuzhouense]PYB77678.1 hypothetical protein DMY87_04845 [Rhizobium wuzhouense]
MSRGDKYASAALGFVAGVGLVLVAVAFDTFFASGSSIATYLPQDDTVAQWLMMIFSLLGTIISGLAVFYVKDTFDQSVIANRQAREFFASENRPWLSLGRPKVSVNIDRNDIFLQVPARNIGNTPAVAVELHAVARSGQLLFVQSVSRVQSFASITNGTGWQNAHKAIFPGRKRDLVTFENVPISGKAEQGISVVYCVTYRSSGGETIFKTAGEVNFLRPSGTDDVEVQTFSFFGVSVAE